MGGSKGILLQSGYAPVAQLDRVFASEAKGRAFESRRARHLLKNQLVTSAIDSSPMLGALNIIIGRPTLIQIPAFYRLGALK
jgi:hypothetical protein